MSVAAAARASRWVSTPIIPSMAPASLLIAAAPSSRGPGHVGLEDTARRFCDGVTTPRVGQAAHQASKAVGQVDAGTTADKLVTKAAQGRLNRCESCHGAGRRSLTAIPHGPLQETHRTVGRRR
jgi:hypothetical protein